MMSSDNPVQLRTANNGDKLMKTETAKNIAIL